MANLRLDHLPRSAQLASKLVTGQIRQPGMGQGMRGDNDPGSIQFTDLIPRQHPVSTDHGGHEKKDCRKSVLSHAKGEFVIDTSIRAVRREQKRAVRGSSRVKKSLQLLWRDIEAGRLLDDRMKHQDHWNRVTHN